MSLLLGRAVPHTFILRLSESSESLSHEQTVRLRPTSSETYRNECTGNVCRDSETVESKVAVSLLSNVTAIQEYPS